MLGAYRLRYVTNEQRHRQTLFKPTWRADGAFADLCVARFSRTDLSRLGNEYLFALVLAGEQVRTVTVALQMFIGENGIDWGLHAARRII
jgi:hypothetical protein